MGFFSNVTRVVGELFDDAGAAVGDVVESVGTSILGPAGQRGSSIGGLIGRQFGYEDIGSAVGGAFTADISAGQERLEGGGLRRALTEEDVAGPVTQDDYEALQRGRAVIEGRDPFDEGTVIDIRYKADDVYTAGIPTVARPRDVLTGAAIGAGMDFIDQITDYFAGGDQGATQQMMMCRPASRRPYTINQQTGCISITRKQQAKLKELVRNVGIEVASKQIGLPVSMVTQLLLKTFRTRRRGISGADLRTVKRVDRQMHSLACALGGISQTSRAVASRKSPPKRSC